MTTIWYHLTIKSKDDRIFTCLRKEGKKYMFKKICIHKWGSQEYSPVLKELKRIEFIDTNNGPFPVLIGTGDFAYEARWKRVCTNCGAKSYDNELFGGKQLVRKRVRK